MMGIENPSEYYVAALYSDGFRFNQNKNNFKYLHLFYMIDTKVIDIVKLYKNEWKNINFSEILERYIYKFPLLDYEKKLLFILISLPPQIKKSNNEFEKCKVISEVMDYVFKTEELIRPYNTKQEEEK